VDENSPDTALTCEVEPGAQFALVKSLAVRNGKLMLANVPLEVHEGAAVESHDPDEQVCVTDSVKPGAAQVRVQVPPLATVPHGQLLAKSALGDGALVPKEAPGIAEQRGGATGITRSLIEPHPQLPFASGTVLMKSKVKLCPT